MDWPFGRELVMLRVWPFYISEDGVCEVELSLRAGVGGPTGLISAYGECQSNRSSALQPSDCANANKLLAVALLISLKLFPVVH